MITLSDLGRIMNAGFEAQNDGKDPMKASLEQLDKLERREAAKADERGTNPAP